MSKKNTAHRPSQSDQEWVITQDGRRVRNTAYQPKPVEKTVNVPSEPVFPLQDDNNYDKRIIDDMGNIIYLDKNQFLHRTDGLASIPPDGTREWYWHGHLHREDGPAVEWSPERAMFRKHTQGGDNNHDASLSRVEREWWIKGDRHREDGPTVEWENGVKEWWVDGRQIEEGSL